MKGRGIEAVVVLALMLALAIGGIFMGIQMRGAAKCLAQKIACGGQP